MNLSISNANTIGRKHIKGTYIAAACAVALTAAVVAGNVSWQHRSSTRTGGLAPTSAAAEANMPSQSFVYYLVRSQQEAAELTSLLSSEGAAYGIPLNATVLVDGPETRGILAASSGELMQAGAAVRVVEPAVSPEVNLSKTEATPAAKAATMAGVISSEHGSYVFDAAPIVTRQVSDSDLMAGITSTVHAAWIFPAD